MKKFSLIESIVSCNDNLHNTQKFILYPGMEFDSLEKWWPDSGMRPTRHEGIDICYYRESSGSVNQVTPRTAVPAMADGQITGICEDFLGFSVFVAHPHESYSCFMSIYAHIIPFPTLETGMNVNMGQVLGRVADTSGRKNRMVCHLHFSLLGFTYSPPPEVLDWHLIGGSGRKQLIDPLTMIHIDLVEKQPENPWERI